jgi:hypothetical protein
MTGYDVRWTDTVTGDHRVTEVCLVSAGTADMLAPIIAAAALGGIGDEGRVRVDSVEVKH